MNIINIDKVTVIEGFLPKEDNDIIYEYCKNVQNWSFDDPNHDKRCTVMISDSKAQYIYEKMFNKIASMCGENEVYVAHNVIQKYIYDPTKEFPFSIHADANGYSERSKHITRSAIYYVNDDFTGGELFYPNKNLEIKPKPGMLVMHPPTEEYKHGVKTITSGYRYVFVGFFYEKDYIEKHG